MRSATVSAFWRSQRMPAPGLSKPSAWMMSPNVLELEQVLCIATSRHATRSLRRSTAPKYKSWRQRSGSWPRQCLHAKLCALGCCSSSITSRPKQIIAPALNTLVGGPSKVFEASGDLIKGAIHALVKRAIKSADIRPDLDPLDLLRALITVSNVASVPGWPQSARRLVDILLLGSRPIK